MRKGLFTSAGLVAVLAAAMTVPISGTRSTFVPDWTFSGSTLAGWQVVGDAKWQAASGELVGTATSPSGGWLMLDKGFQDLQFGADFKCAPGCKTGVLLRAEKTDSGIKGVFVSLDEGALGSYAVTLDASGKELTRDKLTGASGMIRFAPTPPPAAREGGAGRAGRAGGPPAGGRGPSSVTSIVPHPSTAIKPNDWNDLEIIIDATLLRPIANTGYIGGSGAAVSEEMGKFGPVALYVGGTGEVRFRDVSYKDVNLKRFGKEEVSSNYRMQRLTPFQYSWAQAVVDVNRDGQNDIIIPPFIFMGPDYTTAREALYAAETLNPSTVYPSVMVGFAGDFTGDGWPDFLSTNGGRLYVNPKGEPRRWDVYPNVIPGGVSEICIMKDIDGDGKLDLVHAGGGVLRYSKPDPANPTGPWLSTVISEPGSTGGHAIGAGDINGDGKMDVVNAYGWWEQPASGQGLWTYHPEVFSRWTGRASEGAGEMGVYDVNGDKLADVVTVLQAHGFGLAWFEQKRDASGKISFVRHMIADDFASKNAGGVTFSEPHGSTFADMTGDGIPDFIVGKRLFSHHEGFLDPDPYGPPVLYVYKTVRNPKAPGGAEFVPELVHNQSGAGSMLTVADINKDGSNDIVTSGVMGAFAFFGKVPMKR